MKHLKLIVEDNIIKYDSTCDYSIFYQGMTEPVRLTFSFSPEWKNRPKVAAFFSLSGKEYPPQVLKDGKSCIIPTEVLKDGSFKVQVLGKDEINKILTTKCAIYLKGGNE